MTSISLPFLMGHSLVVSALVAWMAARGTGLWTTAGATLAVCIGLAAVPAALVGSMPMTRHTAQYLLLFSLVPSAVVLATSRVGILQARPWNLLWAGPVAFLCAVIAMMVAYNILFAAPTGSR